MNPVRHRIRRVVSWLILSVLTVPLLVGTAFADGGSSREVRVEDKCEPTSFNAVLGPNACQGSGDVTLAQFNAELQQNHSVGAWRMNNDHFDMVAGQTLSIVSRAGETHTFTLVKAFGGGFVQSLNNASGNPTPAPECLAGAGPTFLFIAHNASASLATGSGTPFTPAIYRFQCCIHPWMRTTLHRKHDGGGDGK